MRGAAPLRFAAEDGATGVGTVRRGDTDDVDAAATATDDDVAPLVATGTGTGTGTVAVGTGDAAGIGVRDAGGCCNGTLCGATGAAVGSAGFTAAGSSDAKPRLIGRLVALRCRTKVVMLPSSPLPAAVKQRAQISSLAPAAPPSHVNSQSACEAKMASRSARMPASTP